MVRWLITTFLAWLGLAGFVDGLVEWRYWFEQGVMVHWSSVKAWFAVVIFGWMPFEIPSRLIDYLTLGAVYAYGVSDIEFGPRAFVPRSPDGKLLLRKRLKGYLGAFTSATLGRLPIIILWPYLLVVMTITTLVAPSGDQQIMLPARILLGGRVLPAHSINQDDLRRKNWEFLGKLLLTYLGFIPFLFLVSNVLYQFG